ncbi:hypothetical protein [Brevundimonas sp.]|uniref:hypothetical protein n=1 Tax=Brevundimonas sp. TaxID=1871086 RepID=UPI00286B9E01|nr:hypothetical protein [Brevundimonas sp.]
MTVVTFRIIQTALEKQVRRPGGMSIREAIDGATRNLLDLGESALPLIWSGLADIEALVGPGVDKLDPDALVRIHAHADRLLGYCITIDRPGLPDCLLRICRLADAVAESDLWLPGSFGPLLQTTRLLLQGGLAPLEARALLAGIDQCIARYKEHTLEASAVDR